MMKGTVMSQDEMDVSVEELVSKYSGVDVAANSGVVEECIDKLGGWMDVQEPCSNEDGLWFFRVRTRSSFNDENDIFKRSEHTHLPAEKCNKIGRCHLKNHPVFYGSGSIHGAVEEMRDPTERRYIASMWKLPQQIPTCFMNYIFSEDVVNQGILRAKDSARKAGYKQFGLNDAAGKAQLDQRVKAWNDIFTLKENHELSASIAHHLLYVRPQGYRSMIRYASVRSNIDINYAMHPYMAEKLILYKLIDVDVHPDTGEHHWFSACNSGSRKWRSAEYKDHPFDDRAMPHTRGS